MRTQEASATDGVDGGRAGAEGNGAMQLAAGGNAGRTGKKKRKQKGKKRGGSDRGKGRPS